MSAFLGPIHHWLYNKIKIQQALVEDIIALSQKHTNLGIDLKTELDTKYGTFETRPLEEAIDKGNIHGWLQACVSQVEYKLAYSVTQLLEKKPELFKEIELIFHSKGKENSPTEATSTVSQIYKAISDSLLDGMPCDHANSILQEDSNKVIWKRNSCVHKSYWYEVGGDINNYYTFREAFIKGFLSGTSAVFEKIDAITYVIKNL